MNVLRLIGLIGKGNRTLLPWGGVGLLLLALSSCFGSKLASSAGGEVTGASGHAFSEPAPYGMTLIKRGHLRMGIDKQDTLWSLTSLTSLQLYTI